MNFLKLSDDKTEFRLIGNKVHLRKVKFTNIRVGEHFVPVSDEAIGILVSYLTVLLVSINICTSCLPNFIHAH